MNTIHFFKEDVRFRLQKQEALMTWINRVIRKHGFKLEEINYIFCSDKYILSLNKDFLKHDYFTDIITFDHSIEKKKIIADIFISVDTVKKNSGKYAVSFDDELHRVMIHGVLHLLGYNDKSKQKQFAMRKMEDSCLAERAWIKTGSR